MSSIIRGEDNFDSLESKGLGDGQTWQDVTGSRAAGVIYTNTTGRAIYISLERTYSSNVTGQLQVDGNVVCFVGSQGSTTAVKATATAIVPNGSTYEFNRAPDTWWELR